LPIYDYLCSSCGHRTEVIHGINESGPRFCPSCGAEGTLRKGFTTPAILFKGSGWAKKDRAATRSPASARSSGEGGSDSAAGSGDASAPAGQGSAGGEAGAGSGGEASGASGGASGSGESKDRQGRRGSRHGSPASSGSGGE